MTNTKAQVGDLIRIVNAANDEPYANGDIFEVDELAFCTGDVYGTSAQYIDRLYIEESEYEIHRKADEEDGPTKVKDFIENIKLMNPLPNAAKDAVVQPNHYTQGKFETIEIIEEITKGYSDGFTAYCVGNALKYEARAPFKHDNPIEDLRKAERYIQYAIAHEQRKIDEK